MKDSLSRKQTIFHCLLLRSLNVPDVLHHIYSFVIDAETNESRNYLMNALYIHSFKNFNYTYYNLTSSVKQFSPYIPLGRGPEWAIKHQKDFYKPHSQTMKLISMLNVPGLFVAQVWSLVEDRVINYPVKLKRLVINYMNQVCKDKEFDLLEDDYEVYLQTGIPINIYS
tara:strand:+ start:475 stop:981 length:507 start_codon:yes stop_codon:yes gene_type:complete